MKYNSDIHHRRSIRLAGYDYSQQGAYFITICAKNRECLFGYIVHGKIELNEAGRIAYQEWINTANIRKNITLDVFVIMPNHFHGVVVIDSQIPVGAYCNTPLQSNHNQKFQSPSNNLGSIIRGYKSAVTKQINELRKTPLQPVWQRNYYEHIIRNENDLDRIREYIINNPMNWEKDTLFKP